MDDILEMLQEVGFRCDSSILGLAEGAKNDSAYLDMANYVTLAIVYSHARSAQAAIETYKASL